MTGVILTFLNLQKDIVLQSKIINTKMMYNFILTSMVKNNKYLYIQ